MTEAEIKLKRTESVLKELIGEALCSLNDTRLHILNITEVKCSRGKSDAKIYINPNEFSSEQKLLFLQQLKKARPILETYCLKDQGWFRCPKFTFEFDEQIQKLKNIEELFKKISKKDNE